MASKNILVLVEGAKTDMRLMTRLFEIYNLDDVFEIVSYNTNIYTLYNKMFHNQDTEFLDLLQTLKEHDKSKADIFDRKYSDIILIFDLDPQDSLYSYEKISEMAEYFSESTDNGKLYLNYPMIEAFSHRKGVNDENYISRTICVDDLAIYKQIVSRYTSDPRKLGDNICDMSKIILQNLQKANNIIQNPEYTYYPDLSKVLSSQIIKMEADREIFVLCTCVFFIADYDKDLLR
ncbi:MAG: hypothetical protein R3Y09_11200 [Clostridia bacterium]